jgi:prepilin-type N-terminal cleavage/methylation domain-containing protein
VETPSMSNCCGQHNRRAVTLVELVIVVLLMGIIAGIAAPKYGTALASFRVDCAARRIAADLRLARDYAQKASQAESVDFSVAGNSYILSSMRNPDRPAVVYSVSLAATQYAVDVTSVDFEGIDVIQFDMYGRPDHSGTVVVQSGSKQRTIQVDKVGNVSIQ